MRFSTFTDVLGTIVLVGLVAVLVAGGSNTAGVITSFFSGFGGAIKSAGQA
jgi:hypothetical protein